MTCRIGGYERQVQSGVLGSGVPVAPDPQCRACAAREERGLRSDCAVGPIDTAGGTQRWTDPKPAHTGLACWPSVGHAYDGVPSSDTP